MIELAVSQNQTVEVLTVKDADECLGAGTRSELITVDRALRRRINQGWLNNGVTITEPDSTYIDVSVTIGQDSIIRPNCYLEGETNIGQNCVIGPNVTIRDAFIGDNCHIEQSVLENCTIHSGTRIAPFTYLNDSTIGNK
jgi:bifunctional UDP-N-acetylglucosamine pyrophosphorylase/glucosamine-1-phosphate N-acetyltransferase